MNRRLVIIAALCVAALESLTTKSQDEILAAIRAERRIQDKIWGGMEHDSDHSQIDWLFLIAKHLGKLAQLLPQPIDRDRRDLRDSIAIAGRSTELFL